MYMKRPWDTGTIILLDVHKLSSYDMCMYKKITRNNYCIDMYKYVHLMHPM